MVRVETMKIHPQVDGSNATMFTFEEKEELDTFMEWLRIHAIDGLSSCIMLDKPLYTLSVPIPEEQEEEEVVPVEPLDVPKERKVKKKADPAL